MWTEFWHVFTDPAHVAAEGASTLVEVAILSPVVVKLNHWWHRRHDKEHHGKETKEETYATV